MFRYVSRLALLLGVVLSLVFLSKAQADYPNHFSNGILTDATLVNADYDYFENKFSTSSGHSHNGVDSRKIDLTTYNWTGNPIGMAYGGMGIDNSGAVQGSIMYVGATGDIVALAPSASGDVLVSCGVGANPQWVGGSVVQVVNYQIGALVSGTTQMSHGDTIPVNTVGDEYMTLAITPRSATNKLKIDVVCLLSCSQTDFVTVALFQDSTVNALAASEAVITGAGSTIPISFTYYMTAGTTSATTFKVRAGPDGAYTINLNGSSGTRVLGGVASSSMTITEIHS